MKNINIGIIGYGRIGAEHAGWLRRAIGIGDISVADPTPARLAIAESKGLVTFSDFELLLTDRSIDAILVSTPTAMHFEHASQALSAGKHVMIEKPMALDMEQSQRLIKQASSSNKLLSVFHNRRWDIDFLTVRQAIESNTFGRIINIESRISQWASCVGPAAREYRPNWRNEASYGGGGLYDWGSHLIDQMWQLMLPAEPVRVFAQLRGNVWSKDCDDFARICIDFDHGAVGMVEINTTTTHSLPRWHIDGALGSAEAPASLKYDTREWAQLQFRPADGSDQRILPIAPVGLTEPEIWSRFASSIHGDGEPAVTVKTVLQTMRLIDAARQSSEKGIAVAID
ncbi:MAG TPA: Gfo/Idh/MocA family oxidoreductase [Tepidisphaeraceae bacterium]|nr:Gfo/Idh/MocA family oxidoreductase [Tepidisphaeraceae bacterium]